MAKGDTEAIEETYRTYFHRLRYYGIQVAGREYQQEVEDVIHDFFMWLTQHYHKVEQIRNFEVYMFQSIRRNLQSKQQAGQGSQASFERYVNRTTPLQETSDHSPEELHIHKEEQQGKASLIRSEIDKLAPYQKEILYLRYFEDKSYKEISAILSISEQVAYNYVSRAIKRLKKQLNHLTLLFPFLMGIHEIFGAQGSF